MSFCLFCNKMHCEHVPRISIPPDEENNTEEKTQLTDDEGRIIHTGAPVMDLGFGR